MRILIADDEELVRYSVRSVLEELFAENPDFLKNEGPPRFAEAATGPLMTRAALEFRPDAAFVDIRMPGLSGLEAIDRINRDQPGIKWILLSGYSEFEYARRALSLGVLEYLVKPVDPRDLSRVMEKITEVLYREWEAGNRDFERRAAGIINNLSSPEFDSFFKEPKLYGGLLLSLQGRDEKEKVRRFHDYSRGFRESLRERRRGTLYALTALEAGNPVILAAGPEPSAVLEEELARIETWNRENRNSGYSFIARTVPDFMNFPDLIEALSSLALTDPVPVWEGDGEDREKAVSILVKRARDYGDSHFTQAVGVAQAADFLGVTPNYLSSCFNRSLGITFTRYITNLRLARARELLAVPGITVKEAAASLGYQSSRHFARLFREYHGCSPSEFLQNL